MDEHLGEVPMGDVLASKQFKFIVGPNGKEFSVHAEALTKISPVLRVLMTGSMREATEGVATLDDIDEEDFLGLCEYAYSGKYTAPEPRNLPPRLFLRPEGEAAVAYGYTSRPRSLLYTEDSPMVESYNEWVNKYGVHPNNDIEGPDRNGTMTDLDWTENILRHAKMYIIADRYDVSGLRALAIFYLFWILCGFEDTWDQVPSIEKLIRLTYKNTREHDELRGLISSYVALKSETLFLHPNMQSVRDECPEFCSDVLQATIERFAREQKYLKKQLTELKWKKGELGVDKGAKHGRSWRPL